MPEVDAVDGEVVGDELGGPVAGPPAAAPVGDVHDGTPLEVDGRDGDNEVGVRTCLDGADERARGSVGPVVGEHRLCDRSRGHAGVSVALQYQQQAGQVTVSQ